MAQFFNVWKRDLKLTWFRSNGRMRLFLFEFRNKLSIICIKSMKIIIFQKMALNDQNPLFFLNFHAYAVSRLMGCSYNLRNCMSINCLKALKIAIFIRKMAKKNVQNVVLNCPYSYFVYKYCVALFKECPDTLIRQN